MSTSSKRKRGQDRRSRNSGDSATAAVGGLMTDVTYPRMYDPAAIERHEANVVSIPCHFTLLLHYVVFLQNASSIHRHLVDQVGLVKRTFLIIKQRFVQGKVAIFHFHRLYCSSLHWIQ